MKNTNKYPIEKKSITKPKFVKGGKVEFGKVLKVKDIENINQGDILGFVYKEEGKTTYRAFGKADFFDEKNKWEGFDIDGFPFEFDGKLSNEERNNPEFELKDIENSGTYWSLYKINNEKMADGGRVKFYNKENERLGRPNGSIEKEILEKVKDRISSESFVGSFGWKTSSGKLGDGYLYKLDEFDQSLVRNISIKQGEKIFRYITRTTAIGGMMPLIKINLDKALLYFNISNDNDDVVFETKGIKAEWVSLIEDKFDNGGGVNNYTEAEKWWGNDLSLNEQKEYAKKHLQSFEYDELLGSTAQYSKRDRRQKFINEIWEKEGSPKSVLEGLYSNGGGIEKDYSGKYEHLRQFISDNKLQQIFSDKYKGDIPALNVDNWDDYTQGELGSDEEVMKEMLGKNYKILYDEENDEFIVSKKKTNNINFKIILSNKNYDKKVHKVIGDSGIFSEYEPRFVVLVGDKVIGGSTYKIDDDNVYHFDLGISEKYQGYGVSKELIDRIVEDAKKLKASEVNAYVVNNMLFQYFQTNNWNVDKSDGEKYAWKTIRSNKKEEGGLMATGGLIVTSDWGNDGSTPSNNKDYNALYEMFPDNHAEAKSIWEQLSEKQKEGFLYDLRVTDAGSEHIEESWLEFINASSYEDWLKNATNWDEFKNGGDVNETIYIEYLNKKKGFQKDKKVFNGVNAYEEAVKWGRKNLENFNLDMIRFQFDNGGGVGSLEKELRKLQRDLNSSRLSTYIEGDESGEAIALKKEREVKIARFNEVLQLLNEKDSKFDNGGGVGEDKTRIANEIVKQLGGMGRLNIMTGAYNFIALPNGVSFRIKNPRANYIKVTLNSMDEYDVEIGRIRGDSYKIVSEIKGIDVSGLKGFIEKGTGMYLSLKDGGSLDDFDEIIDIFYERIKWKLEQSGDKNHPSVQRELNRLISIHGSVPEKIQQLLDSKNIERKLKIGDKIIYSFGNSSNNYPIKGEVESIEGDNIFILGDTPRSLSIDKSLVQKIISDDEYSKFNDGGGIDNYEESLNKMITKLNERISYYKERKNDLENKRIRPNVIIGTGYKPQYARKLAFEWLDEQISKDEKDLSFKQGLLKSLKEGNNIILYNLEGKGVIKETEQDGYVTVSYINGLQSAYKKETLDKIKFESTPINEEKNNIDKNNEENLSGFEILENTKSEPTRAETIEAIDGLTVMLDIEPDNNDYKKEIENLKNYINSLPKESFADLNNPKYIDGFIYKPTGDILRHNIYQGFNINYDESNVISSIELWGQEKGIMYKIKTWNSDVIGSVFNGDEEIIDTFEQGAEILIGGKADYLSLVDIAEMHKVSLDHILRQAKMGMNVEREHTNDTNKIVEIVKDHLVESPDYYTKLQKIESSFENGGGVEGYWIDVPSNLKDNFFALASSLGYTQSDLANLREAMLKQDSVKEENGFYRYVFSNEMDLDKAIVVLNKIQNPDYRNDMPKNLNQLKNYIEVGKLLRVTFNKNRPDWVGNIKVVVQTQTNGFYMKDGVRVPSDFNPNDFKNKSWIEYPKSNFITFSPFGFTIYAPDIRDKSKLVKWLQYEYVVGEQLEIAMNTEQSDTFLYNNAVKMMEFVNKVYDLSETVAFLEGGKLTPEMFSNKLDYNFNKESVSCFINAKNTGRMLILRRADEDYKGCWSLMSGGVDMGEVPDETIKREIQEELGVNLNYDTLNYINATKHPERTHHYFELTVNEEFEPVLNPENDAYMWINMSELPNKTHPLLIKYIKSDILV